MELRHLRYFLAVAEERHFTRAAKRLGIAQPALSQQIRQLEQELGLPLLDRSKGRVELLVAGEVFMQEAQRTLVQADYAVRAARRAHEGKAGRLTIGLLGSFTLLLEVLKTCRRDHTDIELELRESTSAEQLTALREGRLDIGFMRPFPPESALASETVVREPLVVALPPDHPLAGQDTVTLTALKHEDFVIFPRRLGPNFYDHITELCRQAGFQPRIVQEAVRMPTIVSLVAAGMGIALVPEPDNGQRRTDVMYVAVEENPFIDLVMVWRESDHAPALKTFVRTVRETVASNDTRLSSGTSF